MSLDVAYCLYLGTRYEVYGPIEVKQFKTNLSQRSVVKINNKRLRTLWQERQWLLTYCYSQPPGTMWLSNISLGCTWMGDRIGMLMSISADSPANETLNRGPLALLLRRQYEFPSGIKIVQFSIIITYSTWYVEFPKISISTGKQSG